ncbi:hypothetical protein CYMTET_3239 [Cymbomonas tetramitiformis]|uniref:Uncharacterized protein n=1 Tax=Cymbomonas tetramitiformis TaxID=36881 RepID=A0AAE0LLL0_9CHLO|nr:hypothetical protein CYMTET_3239 [Cymbomonas tetramitiformis]
MARFNSANLHELRRIIGSRVGVPEFCFNGTSNKDTGASVDARIVDLTIVTSKRCCERAYALISVRCVDDGRVYQLPAWTLFVIPRNAAALFVPEIRFRDETLYQPGYARNVIFSELCNSFGVKSALVLDGPSGNTARMLRSHVPTVYQATNDATALLALAAQGDVPLHVPMCGLVGPSGARPRVSGVYQMLHRAYTKPGSLTIEARRAATEAEAMALDIFGAWNAPMYDDVLSAMATRKPRSVEVMYVRAHAAHIVRVSGKVALRVWYGNFQPLFCLRSVAILGSTLAYGLVGYFLIAEDHRKNPGFHATQVFDIVSALVTSVLAFFVYNAFARINTIASKDIQLVILTRLVTNKMKCLSLNEHDTLPILHDAITRLLDLLWKCAIEGSDIAGSATDHALSEDASELVNLAFGEYRRCWKRVDDQAREVMDWFFQRDVPTIIGEFGDLRVVEISPATMYLEPFIIFLTLISIFLFPYRFPDERSINHLWQMLLVAYIVCCVLQFVEDGGKFRKKRNSATGRSTSRMLHTEFDELLECHTRPWAREIQRNPCSVDSRRLAV